VVHGFHNQRVLLRPVVPVSREQAGADSIVRAAGRALGGHWKGGFDEGETRYDEHFAIFRAARPGVESAKKAPPIAGLIPVSGKSAASLPSQGRRRQGWIDRSGTPSEPSSDSP